MAGLAHEGKAAAALHHDGSASMLSIACNSLYDVGARTYNDDLFTGGGQSERLLRVAVDGAVA